MHLRLGHVEHRLLNVNLDRLQILSQLLEFGRVFRCVHHLVLQLLVLHLKDHELLLENLVIAEVVVTLHLVSLLVEEYRGLHLLLLIFNLLVLPQLFLNDRVH